MPEPQKTRQGKNGGTLKSGNTKNVGRKPSVVRQAALDGFASTVAFWTDVAAGKRVVPYQDKNDPGKTKKRYPNLEERLKATEMLAKYSGVQKVEVTGPDDGAQEIRYTFE